MNFPCVLYYIFFVTSGFKESKTVSFNSVGQISKKFELKNVWDDIPWWCGSYLDDQIERLLIIPTLSMQRMAAQ